MTNEDSVEMEVTTEEYVYTTTVPEKLWLCDECRLQRVEKRNAICFVCEFAIKYDDEMQDLADNYAREMHDDTY